MSTELTVTSAAQPISAETMELVIGKGNLSSLDAKQRVEYLGAVCRSMGLNPLTRPIQLITMDGKTVPYATRDCTDQLRRIHDVSVEIVSRERVDDTYIVTARASMAGRRDEAIGAVSLYGAKNEAVCNAIMKAETKAKRRVTLSICGLGFIDETEVDSALIADAPPVPVVPDVPWSTKRQMIALFEGQKERIGAEAYYQILGAAGVEEAATLTDRGTAAQLWAVLQMTGVVEAA